MSAETAPRSLGEHGVEEHGHLLGEGVERHATEIFKWGHAAINKFPDVAGRYKRYIGAGTLVLTAAGVFAGYEVHKAYKRKHGVSDEEALEALQAEHFTQHEDQQKEGRRNGNNGFKPTTTAAV